MVEKYRGIMPPGSIWYHLDSQETRTLLKHLGMLRGSIPEEVSEIGPAEIQAARGKTEELEQVLREAGLKIITLYD